MYRHLISMIFAPTGKINVPYQAMIRFSSDQSSKEDVKDDAKSGKSKRLVEFRKKLRETTPITDLGEQTASTKEADPLPPWPDNTNPNTGEVGGPRGPEPTRYGDWERKGRVSDF